MNSPNCIQCGKASEYTEDYEGSKVYTCVDGHRTGTILVDGFLVSGHFKWLKELKELDQLPEWWGEDVSAR